MFSSFGRLGLFKLSLKHFRAVFKLRNHLGEIGSLIIGIAANLFDLSLKQVGHLEYKVINKTYILHLRGIFSNDEKHILSFMR